MAINKAKFAIALCALGALTLPSHVQADSPLPPPSYKYYQSPSISCAASTDPQLNRIDVYKPEFFYSKNLSRREVLWTVPQWARQLYVADNCQFIITLYGGLNLLSLDDKRQDTVVFTLHHMDGREKTLPLSKLYSDLDVLLETASHWAWNGGVGWNGQYLTVHTVDGREVRISETDFE